MAPSKTQSFVVELPLATTPTQESILAKRLKAARQLYNACLGEALRRLRLMRESRDWQRARGMPRGPERSALYRGVIARFEFSKESIEKVGRDCRNRSGLSRHIDANTMQTTATRAFRAVEQYSYGKRGRPRFKGHRGIRSVEGKTNKQGILWRSEAVARSKLEVAAIIDPGDVWLCDALNAKTKYCRIIRRSLRGRDRWHVQLVQTGFPPTKDKHKKAREETKGRVVGLDLGPSTTAVVGEEAAMLRRFCPTVRQPWKVVRRIQRAMDRSRRATNPDNYNADGTIKRGPKRWYRSGRYQRLRIQYAEAERQLGATRVAAHGQLCNEILAQGSIVRTEKLSYRSFQRNFGRSVKVRAPGMFVSKLKRKAESAGGCVEEFPTRTTRLSQVCHGCGEAKKKPLSLRTHQCECGIGPMQRDLYSAFLARHVYEGRLDASQAQKAWSDVEPLLRWAASSFNQPASGRASAAPQVRASERVVHQGREDVPSRPRMSYRQETVRRATERWFLFSEPPGFSRGEVQVRLARYQRRTMLGR